MQRHFCYNLSDITDFNSIMSGLCLKNEQIIVTDYSTKTNKKYKLVRYNKDILSVDNVSSHGLLKSVVINSDNKVVGFSPPKSLSFEKFVNKYSSVTPDICIEEMIDGIMINLFWDETIGIDGGWEISTRNEIGGNILIGNIITLNTIFQEVCKKNKLDIHFLNKNYCYSFVLQHPSFKIINSINQYNLYLVELYKIDQIGNKVFIYPIQINLQYELLFNFNLESNISYPKIFTNSNNNSNINNNIYDYYINKYASFNSDYKNMGIIIRNNLTGERSKILNPNYLMIKKQLKKDDSKLLYTFLTLRQQGKIVEYLISFPKYKKQFMNFRENLHKFTKNLFKNYINYYVKKTIVINDILDIYKPHINNLHFKYIKELRQYKLFITIKNVIDYVNELLPCQQMFILNYLIRRYKIDTLSYRFII
jgi:hypothetical protein